MRYVTVIALVLSLFWLGMMVGSATYQRPACTENAIIKAPAQPQQWLRQRPRWTEWTI